MRGYHVSWQELKDLSEREVRKYFKRWKKDFVREFQESGKKSGYNNSEIKSDLKIFSNLIFYLLLSGSQEIAVQIKDLIYAVRVDVLKTYLNLCVFDERERNEFPEEITNFLGGGIPEFVDYLDVLKAVRDVKEIVQIGVTVVLVLFLIVLGYELLSDYLKKRARKPVQSVSVSQEVLTFTQEEKEKAEKLAYLRCFDEVKKVFEETLIERGSRIEEVSFQFQDSQNNQKVSCSVVFKKEYLYPVEDSVKTGDYYVKSISKNVDIDRKVLKELSRGFDENVESDSGEACVEFLLKTGFDVKSYQGGIVHFEMDRILNSRLAFRFPEFMEEIVRKCRVRVNSFQLKVYEGGDEEERGVQAKASLQLKI